MDPFGMIGAILLFCIAFAAVVEVFGDWTFHAIGVVLVVGGCYGFYKLVCYPIYLVCHRFISEHPGVFVVIVVLLIMLLIMLWALSDLCRSQMNDYTEMIQHCDREIARATEALARARKAEEDYRLSDEFEMLAPGRFKYGYNPNSFEREVDRCEETLKRLKDDKRYYEAQRRKVNKLTGRT